MNTRIEEISIDKFDLSLSGMRIMNMTRILQVEKSMRLHGQLQPVVARVHEGGYQLIDGFKRFYASEDLMMEALQCLVLEIDLAQAKVLLLSYNRLHQSMEAWEEAIGIAGSPKDPLDGSAKPVPADRLQPIMGQPPPGADRQDG